MATASSAACSTNDLKITIGDDGGGAAGSFYSAIDFTNTSKASCTLYGYPGVSLRDSSFGQIGAAAVRGTTTAPSVVTLAPGATGNAVLRMTDPGVYSPGTCHQATSSYLMIYPPNQTESYELPFKEPTCSNSSIKMLTVNVVAKGKI
ncbi:MAG: DUF4232 domain-containing protein [Trebonia sp.]